MQSICDAGGADSQMRQCEERLRTACLQGLTFYKVLMYQAQRRFGFVAKLMQETLDEAASSRADEELVQLTAAMPAPSQFDSSSFVFQCLVKMGDLARYVTDALCKCAQNHDIMGHGHEPCGELHAFALHGLRKPYIAATRRSASFSRCVDYVSSCRYLAHDSAAPTSDCSKAAWQRAVQYYSKAHMLQPGSGKPHNQLAVVEELRASDSHAISLGACVHFGLACMAASPLPAANKNWLRSIGHHRDALSKLLPPQRMARMQPTNMCARVQPHALGKTALQWAIHIRLQCQVCVGHKQHDACSPASALAEEACERCGQQSSVRCGLMLAGSSRTPCRQ